jgi:threonine dehydrogenase-like Zn-dependent dehydrogenase
VKAMRLVDVGRFEPVELPPPTVGPTDVLVRITAVSICGSDLLGYLGQHPRIKPPTVLGHEPAGVVTERGGRVSTVKVGQRVAVDPTFGCGTCRHCLRGRKNVCHQYIVIGESDDLPGATAGWVAVPWDSVHPLPDSVSDEEGALVQPLAVSLHATRDQGQVQAGQTILVFGAGQIGLGILLAARVAGARTIMVDPLDYRLEMAHALGAEFTVNPTTDDLEKTVRDATDGYGVDVAFDAVGGASDRLFVDAVRLTARGGRIVVAGLKIPAAELPIGNLKFGEKIVIGSQAHPDSFPEVIRRIAAGVYPAQHLITHRFPIPRIAEALDLLERRADGVMKVVLTAVD